MRKMGKLTDFGMAAKTKLLELSMNDSVLAEKLGISRAYLCDIFFGYRSGTKYRALIVNELGLDPKFLQSKEKHGA